jgi:hypothetical protein
MALEADGLLGRGQGMEDSRDALAVHEQNARLPRDEKTVFGDRIRVTEVGGQAHPPGEGRGVGAHGRIDKRDVAVVFAKPVARGEGGDHLARAGNRLRVEHGDARMQVAKEHRLPAAIRMGSPQVVKGHLAPIDIFPARVEDPAIGQRPRGVVVLIVARDEADVPAVAVAAVEHGHRDRPAVDPTAAPARTEKSLFRDFRVVFH